MGYILSKAAPATRTISYHYEFLAKFQQAIAWTRSEESSGWIMSRSYLYLCPTCGKLWATAPLTFDSGALSPFSAIWGTCQDCGGPESFLANAFWGCIHDFALFDALPLELLSRELHLL